MWNAQLAQVAAPLIYARLRLVRDLGPHLASTYDEVSAGQSDARITYRASLRDEFAARLAAGEVPEIEEIHAELLASYDAMRERCPVAYDGGDSWTVFGHADTLAVVDDTAGYSNEVSRHRAELVQAFEDFQAGRLGTIPAHEGLGGASGQ